MGMLPEGYTVNDFLTDPDAYFIKTDAPRGFIHFERTPLSTNMEPDFDTGNMRFKARERFSFGFSDARAVFGSSGRSLINLKKHLDWGGLRIAPFFLCAAPVSFGYP
jgi:hypothetical protein